MPSATMVSPMVSSLTPTFFATNDELSTNLFAPQINNVKEPTKPRKFTINSIIYFTSVVNRDYDSTSKIQYNLIAN